MLAWSSATRPPNGWTNQNPASRPRTPHEALALSALGSRVASSWLGLGGNDDSPRGHSPSELPDVFARIALPGVRHMTILDARPDMYEALTGVSYTQPRGPT